MNFISENEQPDVLQFMQLAGFGNPEQRDDSILEATLDSFDRALFDSLQDPDQKIPASQLTVDEGFIESYSVKQRYMLFSYVFEYTNNWTTMLFLTRMILVIPLHLQFQNWTCGFVV